MIIESARKNLANKKVRLGNKEYVFDKDAKIEIKDEKEAKALIEGVPYLYEEGKIPVVDNKGKELDPEDKETVEYLNEQLKVVKSQLEARNKKIEQLKKEVQVWKDKCQELLDGTKSSKEESEEKKEDEKPLKEMLEEKTLDELKAIYKEAGGNLQGIRTKEQVINKLLELDKE